LGFRFWGLGFRVQGSGFRVQGLGFRVQGLRFRVWELGFGLGGRIWVWRRTPSTASLAALALPTPHEPPKAASSVCVRERVQIVCVRGIERVQRVCVCERERDALALPTPREPPKAEFGSRVHGFGFRPLGPRVRVQGLG